MFGENDVCSANNVWLWRRRLRCKDSLIEENRKETSAILHKCFSPVVIILSNCKMVSLCEPKPAWNLSSHRRDYMLLHIITWMLEDVNRLICWLFQLLIDCFVQIFILFYSVIPKIPMYCWLIPDIPCSLLFTTCCANSIFSFVQIFVLVSSWVDVAFFILCVDDLHLFLIRVFLYFRDAVNTKLICLL